MCSHLKTKLEEWIGEIDQAMTECYKAFESKLDEGLAKSNKESCETVLKRHKIFHFGKVKCLVRNNGTYKRKPKKGAKGTKVDLNERLSKHMREAINSQFCKTFP